MGASVLCVCGLWAVAHRKRQFVRHLLLLSSVSVRRSVVWYATCVQEHNNDDSTIIRNHSHEQHQRHAE
jgi:hypothetical protein